MAETATYTFVDDLPEVAEARLAERTVAEDILAERQWRQEFGLEPVQEPVDPMSTARHVNWAEAGSPERADLYEGLLLDCHRLVAEWYRKKKPEYFPPTRHVFNEESQEFFSNGLSIRQMTENALIPISDDPEEEQRRVNERVEDATPQLMRGLGKIAIGEEAIRTISECTDTAIASYEFDQAHDREHRGYRGYVPEIKKLMIRDIRLDEASSDRFEEQIGLPGIYITHEIIQMTLQKRGLATADELNKTELHGSQILVNDDIMDFARELDEVASDQWCTNIFMGEEVPQGYHKDYENFRTEALDRQNGLTEIAEEVAQFVLYLDETEATRGEALVLVEEFVKLKLGRLGMQDPELAEQMFDVQTAVGLQEVAQLEASGRYVEAELLFNEVIQTAPGGGSCGGGSCGLESLDRNSSDAQLVKQKLDAKEGDTITKDKVRACKNCGERKLYYAHNSTKVNTWCKGCDSVVKKTSYAPAA